MGSPYATQEDPQQLWYEQSNYVSTHLASVGYGVHLVVFATVTYYNLLAQTRARFKKMWIVCLIFNTTLFALGTIDLACSIRYNENAWVNDRAYPGGPYKYLVEQQSLWFMILADVAAILASLLPSGLLLYRAGVLWNFAWYIVVPPALFMVVCLVLSIMLITELALPNVDFHFPPLSLAVWIILMILPIWITLFIAGRILYHRRAVIKLFGPSHGGKYAGISAVVIEAAIPFTVICVIMLGLFGDDNTAQNLFIPLMVQVECIAPQLIFLRVLMGRAWTRGTLSTSGGGELEGEGEGKISDPRFARPRKQASGSQLTLDLEEPVFVNGIGTLDLSIATSSRSNETD
ncbi:hypothetical protein FB45DRAFT_1060998 [Roridomyces roridus]|uniref:Uncharacterized protein n=1 Tax=Roridomyces roridus TaxID=1738132 RepID=A0AAD7FHV3_9AGAR|nr:hypothetical protein FB45DRAFT_1060998 [Roridomyces roridus]